MTRHRKSRKPGVAPSSAPKEDKKKQIEVSDKKPKKLKGKKPGNRQQEAQQKTRTHGAVNSAKDPRIGNKTPIVLTKNPTKAQQTIKLDKKTNITLPSVKVIDNTDALEEELYAIEADEKLQEIIDKQEVETSLTSEEVDYFNEKMDRHQTLRTKLGWDDDTEEEDDIKSKTGSDDDDMLWDKLDNAKFSEYE